MKKICLLLVGLITATVTGALPAALAAPAPPTLDACIREALAANPDAEAAARRVDEANARFRQAAAGYYPWITLSSGYSRTDNPPQAFMMELNQRRLNMADPAFNPNQPDDTENVRLSAGAKWRLYDGGRRGAERAMAGLGAEAARYGLDAARNELIHAVTRGYYGVLQARAFVTVQQAQVQSLEENLRVARERFDKGSAVKTDVLNLEVKLAQAREDLIRARNGARLAVAALNTAVGRDLLGPDAALAAPADMPSAPPTVDADAPDAVAGRPELQAAEAMARLKERALSRARRDYVPTVNAFGSMDWDSDKLSGFEQSYLVGVQAQWDLFDGFRRPGAVRAAAAALSAARAQVDAARNNLRLDLRQAVLQEQEAHERLAVTGKSIESAEEALRITRERYQQGAADITELLTAQVGLTAIRTRQVAAEYDCLMARSNVERARGALVKEYAP